MREILIQWLKEASKLKAGAKLHLVVSNKDEQSLLHSALVKELGILQKVDPMTAATLAPFKLFKSGRFWVGLEKVIAIPTVGFVKEPSGEMRKITLSLYDADRTRRIRLMCEDGLSLETINELEGPLSQAEMDEILSLKEG